MKLSTLPLLVGGVSAAAALVLPQPHDGRLARGPEVDDSAAEPSWWDSALPAREYVDSSVDYISNGIDSIVQAAEDFEDAFRTQLASATDKLKKLDHAVQAARPTEFPDSTVYQIIKESEHTTKFASIIDHHPDIVELLNSTGSVNHTVFAPIDEAFEHIPKDEKPSKEFVESLLKYHVAVGNYTTHKLITSNTIPTALHESFLGGEPQRLRSSLGLSGITLNYYSKVVAVNIQAKNGVVQGVRSILVPPPMIGRIISLLPADFSTLLLAYDKTDFVKFIHGVKMTGSTVFAPSNKAFSSLGPKANAFLFNTDKGLGYLRALLKYQIAPNATLYTDTFYDKTTAGDGDVEAESKEHFDLGTLLGSAKIAVDTYKIAGLTLMKANGAASVTARDIPGKNGVIQVVDKLLVPPCKGKHGSSAALGEDMTVEELVERLDSYLDDDDDDTTAPLLDSLEL